MNVVLRLVKSFSGRRASGRGSSARAGLADPAGVGLRRDRVAEVLQRVEDVHRAVLDAVLVAGDQAAADAAVVGVLAASLSRCELPYRRSITCVQTDDFSPSQIGVSSTRMSAAITRSKIAGQLVALPAVLGHVRPHAGGDVVVDGADCSTVTPLRSMIAIERSASPWVWDARASASACS
jgi:hypothetical protein